MAVTRPRMREEGLADAIGLGTDELAMRKRFLAFDDDDVHRLEGMYDLTRETVDSVAYYWHFLGVLWIALFLILLIS